MNNLNKTMQSGRMRRGLIVIIALGILTAIEFWSAVSLGSGVFAVLVVIAVIKAWLILDYFMHFSRLWKSEE